jgi:hypothetical protein
MRWGNFSSRSSNYFNPGQLARLDPHQNKLTSRVVGEQ